MTQRLLALHSGPHPSRKGVCPSGIGRPVTSDAHKPGFGSPSWHFRAVGKSVVNSVGNSTRHPAQMARASEEDSGTQWDSLARSLISEDAAGQTSSRRERSTPEPAHGGLRGDDQPQAWDAGLRRRTRASSGSAHDAHSLAGEAYDTEPAQRRSGRVRRRAYAESGGGPDGPLSARDGDQSRPGRRDDSRATGRSAHVMAAAGRGGERPIRQICARSDVMSPLQSKLRAVLAGLAVVVVVGFAVPSVLGAVTVSLWSRSGVFDVSGPARLALFLLDAVAWMAWLRIIVGLCLDVVSGLRHPDNPQRAGGLRGHLAGWVLGFALLVLPGSAMGAGLAGATTAAAPISAPLPATDEVASPPSLSAPISPVSSAPSANSPVVSATSVSTNTVSTNTVATYTVVSGDCLSTIALRFYGDEGAWNEIWAANANRMMADGMRFVDPNLIYAGWILDPSRPGRPESHGVHSNRSDAHAVLADASAGVQAGSGAPRRLAASGRSKGSEWVGGSTVVGAGPFPGPRPPRRRTQSRHSPEAGRPVSARRARLGHFMARATAPRRRRPSAVTPSPVQCCAGYPSPPASEFRSWSRPPICAASGADARRPGPPEATTKPSPTRTRPP